MLNTVHTRLDRLETGQAIEVVFDKTAEGSARARFRSA
jgi:hypothetical protein